MVLPGLLLVASGKDGGGFLYAHHIHHVQARGIGTGCILLRVIEDRQDFSVRRVAARHQVQLILHSVRLHLGPDAVGCLELLLQPFVDAAYLLFAEVVGRIGHLFSHPHGEVED